MKYVEAFRDPAGARGLAEAIAAEIQPGRAYRLMEFCGGHTHAVARHGLVDLLPPEITLIHGPGCPVCVLPVGRLRLALHLAEHENVILCTYGDLMRVPAGRHGSLLDARARGADVRVVYAVDDALAVARAHPEREVVFLAIGFETTTPPTALALHAARAEGMTRFSVLCNHVLTPPAMAAILAAPDHGLDGILGPSHVSTLIGPEAYHDVTTRHGLPLVIAGFEPLDVLQSVLMLIRQINAGQATVENQYTRAVRPGGNPRAQALMAETFIRRPRFGWRGLGEVADSARAPAPAFAAHDAEQRFALPTLADEEPKGCRCPDIVRGRITPPACPLFGTACTPETPVGACMVSSEGACAAHWHHGRFRETAS